MEISTTLQVSWLVDTQPGDLSPGPSQERSRPRRQNCWRNLRSRPSTDEVELNILSYQWPALRSLGGPRRGWLRTGSRGQNGSLALMSSIRPTGALVSFPHLIRPGAMNLPPALRHRNSQGRRKVEIVSFLVAYQCVPHMWPALGCLTSARALAVFRLSAKVPYERPPEQISGLHPP